MAWSLYVLCVVDLSMVVLGLASLCGRVRFPVIPGCGNKWLIWLAAIVQLGVIACMVAAIIVNAWSVVGPDPQYGIDLNFGVVSPWLSSTNGGAAYSTASYGDWCRVINDDSSAPSDIKNDCLTIAIGGATTLLFGCLMAFVGLFVAVFALGAICGKTLWIPRRSSVTQLLFGIAAVVSWICANDALQRLFAATSSGSGSTLGPFSGTPWKLGFSWFMALASTISSLALAALYAQPDQPETVLYQVFENKEQYP